MHLRGATTVSGTAGTDRRQCCFTSVCYNNNDDNYDNNGTGAQNFAVVRDDRETQNIIWRAFGTASIPAVKEPSGLCRNDGQRPDGLTLIHWQRGKPLVWDATVVTPLATSYDDRAATGAGMVSDVAADRKLDKYSDSSLSSAYGIQPIAVDNRGGFSTSTISFLTELQFRPPTEQCLK